MNANISKLFYWILAIIVAGITYFFIYKVGMDLAYKTQSKFIDDLKSLSSIIFGVSGAWLAITYPKAISSAERANGSSEGRSTNIENATYDSSILLGFVRTMMVSILIISVGLIIPYIKVILIEFDIVIAIKSYLKGALFSVVFTMALIQLYLLIDTLNNTNKALRSLREILSESQTRNDRDRNRNY